MVVFFAVLDLPFATNSECIENYTGSASAPKQTDDNVSLDVFITVQTVKFAPYTRSYLTSPYLHERGHYEMIASV